MGPLATSRKIQKLIQQTFREEYQTNIHVCIVKSLLMVHHNTCVPHTWYCVWYTCRVVLAPQMILQPVSSIFPCSPCPLGLGKLQACTFPDVDFPLLPLSALSSSPLSLCLARWFWPDLMNRKHDHTTAVCVSLQWPGGVHVV